MLFTDRKVPFEPKELTFWMYFFVPKQYYLQHSKNTYTFFFKRRHFLWNYFSNSHFLKEYITRLKNLGICSKIHHLLRDLLFSYTWTNIFIETSIFYGIILFTRSNILYQILYLHLYTYWVFFRCLGGVMGHGVEEINSWANSIREKYIGKKYK